mmetsp:Transcript_73435/g.203942  ORF Transcript_73435/g.203942 Transcript_73435/m.203942 type:complete len:1612 (-) Transcript_73435:131-4966(-)
MAPLAALGVERLLPDLTCGQGHVVKQIRAQAECLASASAEARSSCKTLLVSVAEFASCLAKGAAALTEWQRIARAQVGPDVSPKPTGDEQLWSAAVRNAQTIGSHMAALQAEVAEVSRWLAVVGGAQGDLSVELRRWLQGVPKQASCVTAIEILQGASNSPPPLGGESVFLREICERHPDVMSRSGGVEPAPLPVLAASSSSEHLTHDSVWGTQEKRIGAASRSASEGMVTTRRLTEKPSWVPEKPTWACTQARLSNARPSKSFKPAQKKRSGASQQNTMASTASSYGYGSTTSWCSRAPSPGGESVELDAELNATKAALAEAKAEITILRARFRDRAPPVVLRMGGVASPSPRADGAKSKLGLPSNESPLVCTKLSLPKAEGATSLPSQEQEAELRRLQYQLDEVRRDWERAQRFLRSNRTEMAEAQITIEELRETTRRLRLELQEEAAAGTKGRDTQELVKELQNRAFDFSVFCHLPHHDPRAAAVSAAASSRPRSASSKALPVLSQPSSPRAAGITSMAIAGVGVEMTDRSRRPSVQSTGGARPPAISSTPKRAASPRSSLSLSLNRSLSSNQIMNQLCLSLTRSSCHVQSSPPDAQVAGRSNTKEKIHESWATARVFAWRLAQIGGDKAHVEVHLQELYAKFMGDFANHEIGLHEFVGRHAREEEFNLQIEELINQRLGGGTSFVRQASTADLKALEREMAAGYNAAFMSAGGQREAEPRFAEANMWMKQVRLKRGTDRFRQDAGFEILGLDALYDMVRSTNAKIQHEVGKWAVETMGSAHHAPLKGRGRARAKVMTKYGNNPAFLTDMMRASIVYPGINELYDAFVHLMKTDLASGRHDFNILEVTDRFQEPKDGYRDVSILVNVDGVIGEVQLHVQQILDAKSGTGHDAYKEQRKINETLFEACVRANVRDIVALATEYRCCAFGVKDKNGRAALHYACQVGCVEAVRALVQFGAQPWDADNQGMLPVEVALRAACGGRQKRRCLTLRCKLCGAAARRPYDFCGGVTCLSSKKGEQSGHVSALTGHADVVMFMLAAMHQAASNMVGKGAKRLSAVVLPWWVDHLVHVVPNRPALAEWRVYWLSVGNKLIEIVRKNGAQRALEEWMLKAAARGETERVRILLDVGFDEKPKKGEPSVLDLALEHGHEELALLLQHLPRQKHRPKGYYASNCYRCPINRHLYYAAKAENAEYARAALAAKADPNSEGAFLNMGRTPLMSFAASGNLDMCKRLVECRAQVDWHDRFGCGALHYAQALEHPEVEDYLGTVQSGAELPRADESTIEYLCEAANSGCCGAVARFVRSNAAIIAEAETAIEANGSNDANTAIFPSVEQLLCQKVANHKLTPLHIAVRAALTFDPTGQVSRALLLAKADPTLASSNGDTALHLAAETGSSELYDHILQAIHVAHDPDTVALLQSRENQWGQDPKDLLRRTIGRGEMRQLGDEEYDEEDILKRSVFMAFGHNVLLNRLEIIRENKAMTWFEVIRMHKGNLATDIANIPVSPSSNNDVGTGTADLLVSFFASDDNSLTSSTRSRKNLALETLRAEQEQSSIRGGHRRLVSHLSIAKTTGKTSLAKAGQKVMDTRKVSQGFMSAVTAAKQNATTGA